MSESVGLTTSTDHLLHPDIHKDNVHARPEVRQLTEEEQKEARERRLEELPFEQRETSRHRLRFLETDRDASLRRFEEELLRLDQLEIAFVNAPSPELQQYIKDQRTSLAERRQATEKRFQEGLKMVLDYANAQSEATIDPNTMLQTRNALMAEFYRTTFKDYQRTKDLEPLKYHTFYALDMNNFKVGNTLLGHTDFDIVIADMAKGYRALARYLGNEHSAYGNYDEDDEQMKEALDKYFPVGSDIRAELDDAKNNKGILIEFFKDKIGGDEAFFHVHYGKGYPPDEENTYKALAEKFMGHVFHETVIPKKHNEQDLKRMQTLLGEFPLQYMDALKKHHGEDLEEHLDRLSPQELQTLRVLRTLAEYLQTSGITDAILDEQLFIRMGAAWSEVDARKATIAFFEGVDFDGKPRKDEKGNFTGFPLRDADGNYILDMQGKPQQNLEKIQEFNEKIDKKIALGIETGALVDDQEIRAFREQAFSNEVIGTTLEMLFKKVEDEAKPADKLQTVISALTGDPDMMYQLAALRIDGRMDNIDVDTWIQIVPQIMNNYATQFETLTEDATTSALAQFRDNYRQIISSTPLDNAHTN